MLKIGRSHEPESGADVLRLEGKVIERWVDELRRLCEGVLAQPHRRLVLDMADVTFTDSAGTALLQDLAGRQVMLTNCSPFVAEQLRIDSAETDERDI